MYTNIYSSKIICNYRFFSFLQQAVNMGGHEHGHHHEPYKVPNPNTYKVENAAELIYVRDELAKRGLKDPWIR